MSNNNLNVFQFSQLVAPQITESVKDTLARMTKTVPNVGTYEIKEFRQVQGEICVTIQLKDDPKAGAFIITFSRDTILFLMELIFGKLAEAPSTSMVKDGAQEVTNIIYGSLKKRLSDSDLEWRMAIPEVSLGPTPHREAIGHHPTYVVPFRLGERLFEVGISIATVG